MSASAAFPYWPRILRREQAAAYVGLRVSTWDAEVAASRVPRPVQVTNGVKGWDRYDLDAWIEERKAMQASAANDANPWDDA